MNNGSKQLCTAFHQNKILASGALIEVALSVKEAMAKDGQDAILVFDDHNGRIIDLDLRGEPADIEARLNCQPNQQDGKFRPLQTPEQSSSMDQGSVTPARGRPKLGVIAREVTLLPTQWEWLSQQPGGASGTLRKLVEKARKSPDERELRRTAHEAAYRFMHAIAGDFDGYEEATRALFADDLPTLKQKIALWPDDVRSYALRLAA